MAESAVHKMEELKEEDIYDDTVPKEVETMDPNIQAGAISQTPTDDSRATELKTTNGTRQLPRIAPKPTKRQQQDKIQTAVAEDSPVLKGTVQGMPLTPGLYHFDGVQFTEYRNDDVILLGEPDTNVYTAGGSDYCRVGSGRGSDDAIGHTDGPGYESDTSSSNSSQEDIQVDSKLSGLQTLNINIRLNVADLVQSSTPRRQRRNRTRRKTGQRARPSNYEIPETFGDGGDTAKDAVEHSTNDSVFESHDHPPPRPPRVKIQDQSATGPDEDPEQEVNYEAYALAPSAQGKRMTRLHSEPASLGSSVVKGSVDDKSEYYSHIDLTGTFKFQVY